MLDITDSYAKLFVIDTEDINQVLEIFDRIDKVENDANKELMRHGYLTLNDVYEMFGFPLSKEGTLVGWIFGIYPDKFDHVEFDKEIVANGVLVKINADIIASYLI